MPWKKRIKNKPAEKAFSQFDQFLEQSGIAIFLCFGIVFRIFWAFSADCDYNSDASIVYLMGKHILQAREFPLFFYGQAYNGTATSYILALFFSFFGIGGLAIKMYVMLASVCVYVLLILMIQSVINRKTALWASIYATVLPINFYLIPIEYSIFLIAGILFLWSMANYLTKKDRFSSFRIAVLGLISGVGWYFHPLFCYFLILFFVVMTIRILFITTRKLKVIEECLIWGICFLIGSAAYWYGLYSVYGLHDPLNAFQLEEVTYAASLFWTLADTLPSFLTFKVGTQLTHFIGLLVYMTVVIVSLFSLKSTIRKWKHGYFRARLLFQFLFIIVVISFSSHLSAKDSAVMRYLAPLIIVWPVLIADIIEKIPVRMKQFKYILAGIFLVYNSYTVYSYHPSPDNSMSLISNIEKSGIKQGFADYENAYKIAFLSNEMLTVSPFWSVDRYYSYTHDVIESSNKFYLFDTSRPVQNERCEKFVILLENAGIEYIEEHFGTYTFVHSLMYVNGGMRVPVRYFTPIYAVANEKPAQKLPGDDSQTLHFPLALPAGTYTIITTVAGTYSGDVKPGYPTAELTLLDVQQNAVIAKARFANSDFQENPIKSVRFKTLHKSSSPVSFYYYFENKTFTAKYLIIL